MLVMSTSLIGSCNERNSTPFLSFLSWKDPSVYGIFRLSLISMKILWNMKIPCILKIFSCISKKLMRVFFMNFIYRWWACLLRKVHICLDVCPWHRLKESSMTGGESLISAVQFRHTCLERNQRCLLAYLWVLSLYLHNG